MSALETETLYYGDCLDWMSQWDDQCVDLIYLDPPFNSKASYNVLYAREGGNDAQYRAFADTWTWDDAAADRYVAYAGASGRKAHDAITGLYRILGPSGMLAYLTYMAERLEHMHRLLRPTGSIYLHCDSTASHYLKLVMDCVFGASAFRRELAWKRTSAKGLARANYPANTDTILYYAKDRHWTWNPQFQPLEREYVESHYTQTEEGTGRRYRLDNLQNPNPNRPNLTYEFLGVKRVWRWTRERMQTAYENGLVVQARPGGVPSLKRYLDESKGRQVDSVWDDIPAVNSQAKERLGYPTQKPLALLERIIKASSNEGDVVLDPFCGCGTTVEAARKIKRRWAGIDISSFAIDLIKDKRLKDPTIAAKGIPTDVASARKLARDKPFDFESWAVMRLPGFAPNMEQIGDGGVDGRGRLATKPDNWESRLALAQVKGGKFSLSTLRDFIHVTDRDKAALGCYITLDPVKTKAARMEVANVGKISVSGYPYPRMQLWPISDYFSQRMPALPVMNDPYSGRPMSQGLLF